MPDQPKQPQKSPTPGSAEGPERPGRSAPSGPGKTPGQAEGDLETAEHNERQAEQRERRSP